MQEADSTKLMLQDFINLCLTEKQAFFDDTIAERILTLLIEIPPPLLKENFEIDQIVDFDQLDPEFMAFIFQIVAMDGCQHNIKALYNFDLWKKLPLSGQVGWLKAMKILAQKNTEKPKFPTGLKVFENLTIFTRRLVIELVKLQEWEDICCEWDDNFEVLLHFDRINMEYYDENMDYGSENYRKIIKTKEISTVHSEKLSWIQGKNLDKNNRQCVNFIENLKDKKFNDFLKECFPLHVDLPVHTFVKNLIRNPDVESEQILQYLHSLNAKKAASLPVFLNALIDLKSEDLDFYCIFKSLLPNEDAVIRDVRNQILLKHGVCIKGIIN